MKAYGLTVALVLSAGATEAHHSYAAFDRDKTLTVTLTVTRFEYTNPHAWIRGTVADSAGKPTPYALELRSPAELQRQGLRSIDIKPGDTLTANINPARDGSAMGTVISATLSNGKKFGVSRVRLEAGPAPGP